jgi:hypothetical protein
MYAIAEVAGSSRQQMAALSAVIPQLKLCIALVTLAQQRGASDGCRAVPQPCPTDSVGFSLWDIGSSVILEPVKRVTQNRF